MSEESNYEEMCQLERDLYDLWRALENQNYGKAKNKAARCWLMVKMARLGSTENNLLQDKELRQ